MNEIRIGIVGLGWVSEAHILALKAAEGVKVTAICSSHNPSPAELEERFGIPLKVYTNLQDMLSDSTIDAVTICTANMLHAQQTIAALEAGKHVYIEKPIALSYEDAKAIRAAVIKSGKTVCVGFELRFSQQLNLLASVLDKGLLGELSYGEADYYHGIGAWYGQFRWSRLASGGGSALLSAGCHAMDSLLYLMRSPVEEVTSYSTKSKAECYAGYEFDPCSVTIMKFADGKVGKCAACIDCIQPYYFHFQLVGSKGSILDNKLYSSELEGLSKARWTTLETTTLDSGDVLDHPYNPQMQAFVNAIQNHQPMPKSDFESAFQTHKVIYAADMSAKLGRPVKLSELD